MITTRIEKVKDAVGGTFITGRQEVDISHLSISSVSTDSRQKTHNGLFVAIKGERVDGHDYLNAAAHNGYVAALVDHEVPNTDLLQIVVDDTVRALGKLARYIVDRRRSEFFHPFTLIGITGSVGKTTTKDITRAILSSVAPTVAPVGSFNNNIGLPLTALKLTKKTRYFVAEMGASQIGDIRYLVSIAPPDVGTELRVGTAHVGMFGSVENIFKAKSELVEALPPSRKGGIALLNSDDPNVSRMAQETQASVRWFGLEPHPGRHLMVTAQHITTDRLDRPSFDLIVEGENVGHVHLHICGRHHVINAVAAASIAHVLRVDSDRIVEVLNSHMSLSPHRMAVRDIAVSGVHLTLLDDTFNANPDSMRGGIQGLRGLSGPEDPEHLTVAKDSPEAQPYRVAVLGPMLELGDESVKLHRQVGSLVVQNGIDALVAVGTPSLPQADHLADEYITGAQNSAYRYSSERRGPLNVRRVANTDEAWAQIMHLASRHPNTIVLLKGSHASGLSTLADSLLSHAQGE
jgi:UDP-N-acetylmuramoyl-tripeptide--D-alanyl-D-alanine ligase